jgi:hypothetical protein
MSLTETGFMGLHPKHSSRPDFGSAVGRVLRDRYPFHTAKRIATDIDCTVKGAESILAGHLSARSMTKIVQHYGWDLITEAMTEATGQSLKDYIEEQRVKSELEARNWDEKRRGFIELAASLDARRAQRGGMDRHPT